MSETYMITAKTVEEAIAIANREYADESHEVSYEIVEMPKKGFLGIGAKDAKIKITVTKSVSVELDSIVADLRSMKVLTAKGDSGESRRDDRRDRKNNGRQNQNQNQNQNRNRGNQPKQNQQNQQKSAQKVENQQKKDNVNADKADKNVKPVKTEKSEKAQNAQVQPKQQPKSEKIKSEQPKQQPKSEQPKQQPKAEQPKQQPKAEQPKQQPKAEQSKQQPKAEQPKQQNRAEQPKAEAKPVETKVENKAEKTVQEKSVQEKSGSKSNLRNQAKPGKRQAQKKHDPAEADITASSMTVSSPMGLTDYVAGENAGAFGSYSNSGNGRMSNDIRKKKNKPNRESTDAASSANVLKPGKGYKNNSVIYGSSSMTTRYDVAESDEDYNKLNSLEDRELTIDEIRASVKAANVVADMTSDAEEVSANFEEPNTSAPKSDKLRREAVSEAEMSFALEFANTLLKNMGLDASAVPAECPEGEEYDVKEGCTVYPKINVIGDDTGILIGHHGETLDAIQYLVNLSAIRRSKQNDGDYVKIVVDIENYREKREETLRALARRMAARAVKYKRNVFLEPMNAYERRIIHSELQSFENVSTHSVGSDRDRKIIITYEGADKAPDNRNRRRKGHVKGSNANNAVNFENAVENTDAASAGTVKERRRPRKIQKMPIEKIGDILPDFEQENNSVEDEQE